jgi:hypothetical protein
MVRPPAATGEVVTPVIAGIPATAPNLEAVKRAQELAAMMGFRQDPEFAPLINMFPGSSATDLVVPQKPSKVPVLRLDAQGREIDEHGNVINMTKPTNLSTLKVHYFFVDFVYLDMIVIRCRHQFPEDLLDLFLHRFYNMMMCRNILESRNYFGYRTKYSWLLNWCSEFTWQAVFYLK